MASSLRPRIALGLLLIIVAAVIWLLSSQERAPDGDVTVSAATAEIFPADSRLGATARAPFGEPEVSRSKVDAPVPDTDAAPGEDIGPPVHLRVLLRIVDEEGEESIPKNCAGWVVRAQSWLTETGEVFPHEAVANARGIAEFTFPGFVHVDWVGCQPPPASGFGFSQISEHHDFDAGSEEEWTLPLLPRGGARGTVLTMDDRPVGGAEVHAQDPSWASNFEDWTPGFLTTVTALDGSYSFPSLGEGEWIFAVGPGEFLQLDPMLGDADEGKGWAEIAAGETADAGVLRVVSAAEQIIRVVDADGNGVPFVMFSITALSFASPHLRATMEYYGHDISSDDDPSDETAVQMERFLAGEDPESWIQPPSYVAEDEAEDERIDWPYDGLARETGADGRARWQLPPGRYAVECWSTLPGMPEGTIPSFEISVPGAPLLFRLPVRCDSWSGSVVDDAGTPVAQASVSMSWQNDNGAYWGMEVDADEHGNFRFEDVPLLRECILEISSGGHVDTSWQVSLLSEPSAPFCLPRGGTLRVLFKDSEGVALNVSGTTAHLRPLRTEIPPPAPGTLGGKTRAVGGATHNLFQNQLHAYQLARGDYQLSLSLANFRPVQFVSSWSGPSMSVQSSEAVEIGSWPVSTGPETVVIQLTQEQCELLSPQLTTHSGVVIDAETGLPIAGATVSATGFNEMHWERTDADGRFEMELVDGRCDFQVVASGYATLDVDAATASRHGREHEFRLQNAGATLHVRVLDRDGKRLPPCTADVLFPGATGGFPPASAEQGLAGMYLPQGEIFFQSRTLGTHRMRLNFAPGVHAEVKVELRQTRGSAPFDCRLAWSLDDLRAALRAAAR